MGGGESGGGAGSYYPTAGAAMGAAQSDLGGFDYGALGQGIGKGFQQAGSSLSNQSVPNYMTGTQAYSQANIPSAQPQTNLIPESERGFDLAALRRLLQGLT